MIKPEYYNNGTIDVIEYARQTLGNGAAKSFCRINILKYIIRYDQKNGIEDLNKAFTYLDRLIALEMMDNEPTNKSK